MLKSLKRAWPGKRKFSLLEDSVPTGFRSRKGMCAKADLGVTVFEIPKRSPDLSVCDYALWKAVTRRMRRQETKFPKNRRETREQYITRLRQAATSLPRPLINKSIAEMRRRCPRCFVARGGCFEEGGRSKK